jgi:hypothetical protein
METNLSIVTAAGSVAESIPWPQLGAGGLLALAISLILTGRLVPRRISDKWEMAYREERALNRELTGQLAELTELGHTTLTLLQAITAEPVRHAKQDDG